MLPAWPTCANFGRPVMAWKWQTLAAWKIMVSPLIKLRRIPSGTIRDIGATKFLGAGRRKNFVTMIKMAAGWNSSC